MPTNRLCDECMNYFNKSDMKNWKYDANKNIAKKCLIKSCVSNLWHEHWLCKRCYNKCIVKRTIKSNTRKDSKTQEIVIIRTKN